MRLLRVFTFCCAFLMSCSENEGNLAMISGEVMFINNNQSAKNVPLKLIIYNKDIPFDRNNPQSNIVQTIALISDINGHYSQEINLATLPKNLTYSILIDTATLIQITNLYMPEYCSSSAPTTPENRTIYPGHITKNIFVDHSTFFQMTFKKGTPTSTNKVVYYFCLLGRDITTENPDTTFLDRLPFSFHSKISVNYDLIRETGEVENNSLQNILLLKNDTTKIAVTY